MNHKTTSMHSMQKFMNTFFILGKNEKRGGIWLVKLAILFITFSMISNK